MPHFILIASLKPYLQIVTWKDFNLNLGEAQFSAYQSLSCLLHFLASLVENAEGGAFKTQSQRFFLAERLRGEKEGRVQKVD